MNIKSVIDSVLLFLIAIATVSCNRDSSPLSDTFLKVEQCMEGHPDSALILLNHIPHPEKLSGKSQADYALLMTQAIDKNYLDFSSDSLIRFAVQYYASDKNDFRSKGKTYFYYGRVMQELSRHEEAMKAYLQARTILEGSKEYKLLGLISERIGDLCWEQDFLEEALKNYKSSRTYYTYAKDSCCLSYALRNIARVHFYERESFDTIRAYYQSALEVASLSKSASESSIMQELGVLYRERKEYGKAESYFLASLNLEENINYRYSTHLSLGKLYLYTKELFKAEYHLMKCLNSTHLDLKADAYNCLSGLEKERGDLRLALSYKEEEDSIRQQSQKEEIGKAMADLQKKYDNEKLQKENLQNTIAYKNKLLLCLALLVAMVCFLCYYYFKLNEKKKRIREIERVIDSNRVLIRIYEKEVQEYRQREDESDATRNKMGALNAKVLVLSMQNKELIGRIKTLDSDRVINDSEITDYLVAMRLLLSLKNDSIKEDLSGEDWGRIFTLLDFMHHNFYSRLRQEFSNLTKHDIEICCLFRCGFTHEELGRIFHTASDSVTKAKGRLKKRIGISINDDLEEFLRKY